MAVNVATAYLTIVPKFERSIRDAVTSQLGGSTMAKAGRSAGKSLGTSVTSGFGKATSGIKSVLGNALATGASIVAVSGIASGLGDYASAAMQAADSTQKFKSTLTFAGLGGDQIAALSESTRRYADETVYSLSDIQNITAQLAANSVPNYDKLAEAAGNLNAVAGGNAETFKSVGMVLTQTAGQGKLTTENWNQLADAIPGASGKIQRALSDMGAYTGNFREAMEEGEISAEEFNQALMDLGFQDAAVEAENSMEAGRILDIDVLTSEGQLSRLDMGLPPRRCLVCGESAKACARAGTHDPAELRELVIRIIKTAAAGR